MDDLEGQLKASRAYAEKLAAVVKDQAHELSLFMQQSEEHMEDNERLMIKNQSLATEMERLEEEIKVCRRRNIEQQEAREAAARHAASTPAASTPASAAPARTGRVSGTGT